MTVEDVRSVIIESLADKKRKPVDELMEELAAAGPEFPYPSAWLVSAGCMAARKLSIDFKHLRRNARAFKSVDALACYLHQLANDQEAA